MLTANTRNENEKKEWPTSSEPKNDVLNGIATAAVCALSASCFCRKIRSHEQSVQQERYSKYICECVITCGLDARQHRWQYEKCVQRKRPLLLHAKPFHTTDRANENIKMACVMHVAFWSSAFSSANCLSANKPIITEHSVSASNVMVADIRTNRSKYMLRTLVLDLFESVRPLDMLHFFTHLNEKRRREKKIVHSTKPAARIFIKLRSARR